MYYIRTTINYYYYMAAASSSIFCFLVTRTYFFNVYDKSCFKEFSRDLKMAVISTRNLGVENTFKAVVVVVVVVMQR